MKKMIISILTIIIFCIISNISVMADVSFEGGETRYYPLSELLPDGRILYVYCETDEEFAENGIWFNAAICDMDKSEVITYRLEGQVDSVISSLSDIWFAHVKVYVNDSGNFLLCVPVSEGYYLELYDSSCHHLDSTYILTGSTIMTGQAFNADIHRMCSYKNGQAFAMIKTYDKTAGITEYTGNKCYRIDFDDKIDITYMDVPSRVYYDNYIPLPDGSVIAVGINTNKNYRSYGDTYEEYVMSNQLHNYLANAAADCGIWGVQNADEYEIFFLFGSNLMNVTFDSNMKFHSMNYIIEDIYNKWDVHDIRIKDLKRTDDGYEWMCRCEEYSRYCVTDRLGEIVKLYEYNGALTGIGKKIIHMPSDEYVEVGLGSFKIKELTQYHAHVWDGGTVSKAATGAEAGEVVYTCTECGMEKKVTIPSFCDEMYSLDFADIVVNEGDWVISGKDIGSFIDVSLLGEKLIQGTDYVITDIFYTPGDTVLKYRISALGDRYVGIVEKEYELKEPHVHSWDLGAYYEGYNEKGKKYTCSVCGASRFEKDNNTDGSEQEQEDDNNIVVYTSGICGAEGNEENVTWKYDNRVLTISGTGAMADYEPHRQMEPWHYYHKSIRKIVIDEGITHVGDAAFQACYAKEVVFPDTLTSIGKYAFYACDNVASLTFPPNLKSIGEYAFWLMHIRSVMLPEGLDEVGKIAFDDGTYIKEVYIPGTLKTVSDIGFTKGLSTQYVNYIIFGDGVETIEGTYQLAADTMYLPDTITNIRLDILDCKVIYGKNDTAKEYAAGCDWGVKYIDASDGIDISSSIIELPTECAYTGSEIIPGFDITYEGVTLRERVDYTVSFEDNTDPGTATATFNGIGVYKGSVAKNFEINNLAESGTSEQDASEKATSDRGGTDKDNSGLNDNNNSSVNKENSMVNENGTVNEQDTPNIGNNNTVNDEDILSSKDTSGNSSTSNNKDTSGNSTASNKKNIATYKQNTYRITDKNSVSFVKPVKSSVKTLNIPDTIKVNKKKYKVTAIDANACKGLSKLTKVVVGDNVKTVGKSSFADCKKLKVVSFGKGITKLGDKVFSGDTKITRITFKSTKITSFGKKTFNKVPGKVDIIIPRAKMEKYVKLIRKAR